LHHNKSRRWRFCLVGADDNATVFEPLLMSLESLVL